MKIVLLTVMFSVFSSIGCMKVFAQTEKDTKETQEIIIRKSGEKDTKVTVEVDGSKITVNGKPLAEFKDDGITIMNRKMVIREGNKMTFDFSDIDNDGAFSKRLEGKIKEGMMNSFSAEPLTHLGVSTTENKDGVIIEKVWEGSPAEKALLLKDDIIFKVDNQTIKSTEELKDYIRSKKAGDKVKVQYIRNGKKLDVLATLETSKASEMKKVFTFRMPENGGKQFDNDMPMKEFKQFNFNPKMNFGTNPFNKPKIGIKIQDTEDASGVKILNVDKESAGATSGLLKDDILIGIGDKKITNTDEAREALFTNKDKDSYKVKVLRNGTLLDLTVKIAKKLKTANL
jgi:serine protease Do